MNITYSHDLPDKAKFYALFNTTDWNDDYNVDADQLLEVIKNSAYSVSAYDGKDLVGFGRMLSDGLLHAVIFDVIIHPAYQGRGIGKAIMADITAECKKHKIRDIQLFCARGMSVFYEKCGYKPRPEDGPGMELKTKY